MGFRGHGAGHGDMGTWGLGDMIRSIGSHTNTFRVRHGDMGFRGHGAGHGDMGTWGLGDMVRSIGSHTNTFRIL